MKKIIYFICLFVILCSATYATELKKSEITTIAYTGNLTSDTLVNIQGKNLDSCHTLTLDGKNIEIKTNTAGNIAFVFRDIGKYEGTIELRCSDASIKYNYAFPYISKITGGEENNGDKFITISGGNFGTNATVSVKGGSFVKGVNTNSVITGDLPTTLNDRELYIVANGLSSNISMLNKKIPKIDFVYSKNNFHKDSEIVIYGTDLNYYNNSSVIFGNKEIDNIKFDKKTGSISFTSNGELGMNPLKVLSNGIESNVVNINIISAKPIIHTAYIKKIKEEIEGVTHRKEVLVITGENFSNEGKDIKLYNNGTSVSVTQAGLNELSVDGYILKRGDNFFGLDVNGKKSNIFNIKNDYTIPGVSSITIGQLQEETREVNIYLQYFNIGKDKIYLNNSEITPTGCFVNMCKVEIPKTVLKGEFTAGNGIDKNNKSILFDISYKALPFIEYVYIKGNLQQGTGVEVVGHNLSDSSISSSNLFSTDDQGKIDMKISPFTIEGSLPTAYNKESQSTLSISKYGQSAQISFLGKDVLNGKIYGAPYLFKLESTDSNGLFKNGGVINVTGKGLRAGDSILIGNMRTSFNALSSTQGSFILPDIIKEGKYNVVLENQEGGKSNVQEVIVVSPETESKIVFEKQNIEKKTFYLGDTNNEPLYNVVMSNKGEDLIIKNISFKVDNYNKKDYLGTFLLQVQGKEVGSTMISDEGIITFSGDFKLVKSITASKISLIKKSEYFNDSDFKVNLYQDDISVSYASSKKVFNNVEFGTMGSNSISLLDKGDISCVDTLTDNLFCNKFLANGNITKEEVATDRIVPSVKIISSFDIKIKNKSLIFKDLVFAKKDIESTLKGRKYKKSIDIIVKKLSSKKLIKLYEKLDKLNISGAKYTKIVPVINYLKSKVGIEVYIRDDINKK